MIETIGRILSMLALIALGYALKRIGIAKKEDFRVLTKFQIYVTLPAAIIQTFHGFKVNFSMFIVPVLALLFFFLNCGIAIISSKNNSRED